MLAHAELRRVPFAEQIMVMPATRPNHWTREDVAHLVEQRERQPMGSSEPFTLNLKTFFAEQADDAPVD